MGIYKAEKNMEMLKKMKKEMLEYYKELALEDDDEKELFNIIKEVQKMEQKYYDEFFEELNRGKNNGKN